MTSFPDPGRAERARHRNRWGAIVLMALGALAMVLGGQAISGPAGGAPFLLFLPVSLFLLASFLLVANLLRRGTEAAPVRPANRRLQWLAALAVLALVTWISRPMLYAAFLAPGSLSQGWPVKLLALLPALGVLAVVFVEARRPKDARPIPAWLWILAPFLIGLTGYGAFLLNL